MKTKTKDSKISAQGEKSLNLELTWEKITDIETSLRKVVMSEIALPLNKECIETLIKFSKEVIKAIESVKSQEKHYQSVQENYNMIQSKLANHESIVNNMEVQYKERLKSLSDEIKNSKEFYEKGRKNYQESEEQIKLEVDQIRKENEDNKYKIDFLTREKDNLLKIVDQKNALISELTDHKNRFLSVTTNFIESEPKYDNIALSSIVCSSLGHRLLSYLPPLDIMSLQTLNKEFRTYISKSSKAQVWLSRNIVSVKNRKIAYFHKHIKYFEELCENIPEELLHLTFYRCEILKENIGVDILNVLNSSANLFEGKFTKEDDDKEKEKEKDQKRRIEENEKDASQTVIIGGVTVNIEKEVQSVKDFNSKNNLNLLDVDEKLVHEYLEEQKKSKEKTNLDINEMYKKINGSAQLYSIDEESIGMFLNNVLKNFSKVFVMSRNLYTEVKNLQNLNSLILKKLSEWFEKEADKNSQIEDLKAELEAERKLRIFFTEKSIKSEQRALSEENVKLGIESKFQKLSERLDSVCKEKEESEKRLSECLKDIKNLKSDNKEIRKAYDSGKAKYAKIIEELSVVKETIIRMNII